MLLARSCMFNNILVRGTNWVGDSIITIPALREMRRIFNQARITLLVKPWVRDIFAEADFIDEILVYDRDALGAVRGFSQIVREVRSRRFDCAILLQNAFEAGAIAFCARIPFRAGFPTDGRGILLTHRFPLKKEIRDGHELYYYLDLVAQLEKRLMGESRVDFEHPRFPLTVSQARREAARQKLSDLGINPDKALIAINPGATNSRAKRWPVERFAELADRLLETDQISVIFVGAPSELDIAEQALSRMRRRPLLLTGKSSLAESIAVLSICDLVISNDTGPAYISAALQRPTLTIFGPTNFNKICPSSPTAHIIRHSVECSPCRWRDCPIDHRCMTGISVESVFNVAMKLISTGAKDADQHNGIITISKTFIV